MPKTSRANLMFRTLAAAAFLLSAGLGSPALSQSAVKVLVNGQPITTYDIRNRAQLLKLTTRGKSGEKQAIDELIEERLKLGEAKLRGLKVSDSDVDEAFAKIASRTKLAPNQFVQVLAQNGVDATTLKDRIRAEMAWGRIVRARFKATVDVSEQDVARAVSGQELDAAARQTISEYKLQPILFVVPSGAGTAAVNQRRSEAVAFRSRFQGCESAVQVAQGLRDVVVKPVVRRSESDLPEDLRAELGGLAIGGISQPEQVEQGVQLLAVCDKQGVAGATKATDEARSELMNERGQLLARRYLRDLRADAVIEYR